MPVATAWAAAFSSGAWRSPGEEGGHQAPPVDTTLRGRLRSECGMPDGPFDVLRHDGLVHVAGSLVLLEPVHLHQDDDPAAPVLLDGIVDRTIGRADTRSVPVEDMLGLA